MTISKWEDYFLTVKGYFLSKKLMNHTQYYTPEQIETFQFRAVYKLLNEVCIHIPIYQKLFWDYDFDPQTNVVDVLVSRLRSKVDRDFETKLIHTLRGVGYVLKL